MTRVRLALALAGLLSCTVPLPAQAQAPTPVGTTFVYQGHLDQGAGPSTGVYDFRLSLFTAATGGSPIGTPSQVQREDVPVASGVFLLGLDFGGAAFAGARWLEIAVRPGASSGEFTVLTPRQPVMPTPQALHASSARTVAGLGCIEGQVLKWQAGGWTCGVDTASAGTVSVITAGAGLTGGTIVGAGTVGIATGGVTAAMLAPGSVSSRVLSSAAVGAAQVDATSIQLRTTGSCSEGFLQGLGADGTPTCAPVNALPITTRYAGYRVAAAAIRPDGRPVLVVQPDRTDTIRLLSCGDVACTRLSGDVAIGTGTPHAVVVSADDRPAILSGTVVYKCADSTCSSSSSNLLEVVVTISPASPPVMILGADGLPFIVWQDQSVKTAKCLDAVCSSFEAAQYDSYTANGYGLSVAVGADGLPFIVYGRYDQNARTPWTVRAIRCETADCLTATVTRITDRGQRGDVAIGPLGLPSIAYRDYGSSDVVVTDCTNPACTTLTPPVPIGRSTWWDGLEIAYAGHRLVFQYEDWTPPGSTRGVLGSCVAPACASPAPAMSFQAAPFATSRALLVGPDGLPFGLYMTETRDPVTGVVANRALITVKCRTASCR